MRRSWDSKHQLSNSKLVLSATTFTHPPLLSPGTHHSPTMSCTSCFHFAALGMEDLYLHCELRKVYPLFKAQLHGPLPITFPTSPASLIVSISFLWPLYNDIKPSIHPSDHVSIYPPKNHTKMGEDCLPRSIQTQNVLCSAFGVKKKKTQHIILWSKLKKICWRSWCLGKKSALLGIWECWPVRDCHPCDLVRVVSKVTKAGLCNFPYPVPIFLNPIDTPRPAQILLHPQSLPWFSSPIRHEWTRICRPQWVCDMTDDTQHFYHLWLILPFKKHFTIFISCFTFPAGLLGARNCTHFTFMMFSEPSPVPGVQTLKCDCPAETGDPGLEWRRPFNSHSKAST